MDHAHVPERMYILDIFNVTNWLFVLGRVNDKCVGENDNCHVGLPVSILPISFLYLFVAYLGVQNKVPHTQTKPLEHTACNSLPPAYLTNDPAGVKHASNS